MAGFLAAVGTLVSCVIVYGGVAFLILLFKGKIRMGGNLRQPRSRPVLPPMERADGSLVSEVHAHRCESADSYEDVFFVSYDTSKAFSAEYRMAQAERRQAEEVARRQMEMARQTTAQQAQQWPVKSPAPIPNPHGVVMQGPEAPRVKRPRAQPMQPPQQRPEVPPNAGQDAAQQAVTTLFGQPAGGVRVVLEGMSDHDCAVMKDALPPGYVVVWRRKLRGERRGTAIVFRPSAADEMVAGATHNGSFVPDPFTSKVPYVNSKRWEVHYGPVLADGSMEVYFRRLD